MYDLFRYANVDRVFVKFQCISYTIIAALVG